MTVQQSIPSEKEEKSDIVDVADEKGVPDSVLTYQGKEVQKVVREGILLAGGAVAILLQVANPGVGQGVNEHSDFAYRPVDRLRTTMTYVYTITFGTPAERAALIQMVHNAHSTVKGPNYSADDPDLQLWVAATLYAAGTDIYAKIFGDFDDVTAEKLYQDYAVLATALRVPQGMWPENRKAFWAYWDEKLASFEITDHAKTVARDLLYTKGIPLWIRVNMPMLRILTAEWLPPHLRDAYGLKTSKPRRATYAVLMGLAKGVYPHLPHTLREFPLRFYMKDMRKRMKNRV